MTLTEKWVARFKNPDGEDNMGVANHYSAVSNMLGHIINYGGYNIIVTDETSRARIIEGEINND